MTTIDLRSDTVTEPSEEMRRDAYDADVGDDVYGDDPTAVELETRAAEVVGKEAALFVPTGTMGNQIAVRIHTNRGDELLTDRDTHLVRWELGGTAQLSGVQIRTVDAGENGVPTPEQVRTGTVCQDLQRPGTGLLVLENTHNYRGGVAAGKAALDAATGTAHEMDIPVHLDGARLFNAAVARDTTAAALSEEVDTVMISLSKGLGAPVGSILAGSADFVERARRVRKLFGGGMRQVGVLAAPGLRALGNVEALEIDHRNASRLAAGLDGTPGLVASDPNTNIVMVDSEGADYTAEAFVAACKAEGILANAFDEYVTRFCTHRDVDSDDVDETISRITDRVADGPS